jgi:hypothetical protein
MLPLAGIGIESGTASQSGPPKQYLVAPFTVCRGVVVSAKKIGPRLGRLEDAANRRNDARVAVRGRVFSGGIAVDT